MPTTTDLQQLPVARIRRSSLNPRKGRNVARYEAFKASVASQGVLQAIVVRPVSGDPDHDFEIVAGETRWTASIDCGLAYIPAWCAKCRTPRRASRQWSRTSSVLI
ncbi:Nucleoid occlusion protein [Stutzerimonas stutzeri]